MRVRDIARLADDAHMLIRMAARAHLDRFHVFRPQRMLFLEETDRLERRMCRKGARHGLVTYLQKEEFIAESIRNGREIVLSRKRVEEAAAAFENLRGPADAA